MKLVIIESPFKGAYLRNTTYLRSCILDCIRRGESPYASHRMLTDALDDDIPEERQLGIEAGLAWRNAVFFEDGGRIVKPVNVAFYVDLGFTDGMVYSRVKYNNESRPHEERRLPADDPFWLRYPHLRGGSP